MLTGIISSDSGSSSDAPPAGTTRVATASARPAVPLSGGDLPDPTFRDFVEDAEVNAWNAVQNVFGIQQTLAHDEQIDTDKAVNAVGSILVPSVVGVADTAIDVIDAVISPDVNSVATGIVSVGKLALSVVASKVKQAGTVVKIGTKLLGLADTTASAVDKVSAGAEVYNAANTAITNVKVQHNLDASQQQGTGGAQKSMAATALARAAAANGLARAASFPAVFPRGVRGARLRHWP